MIPPHYNPLNPIPRMSYYPQKPQSIQTPPTLQKTYKIKTPIFRKPLQNQQTKLNPYRFRNNLKLNLQGNHKLYSCQKHQKIEKSMVDEMIKNSLPYKQLLMKMRKLEQQHNLEKQTVINSINSKNETINKLKKQEEELQRQKNELMEKQKHFQEKLAFIREENERIRDYLEIYENQEIDLEVLQYAINTDNMTYEELLELEEKMGNVSKGFTQEQVLMLPKYEYTSDRTDEPCTICYYEFKKGEITNLFDCNHRFHDDCISEWLLKEKLCPMCKQEIKLGQQEE